MSLDSISSAVMGVLDCRRRRLSLRGSFDGGVVVLVSCEEDEGDNDVPSSFAGKFNTMPEFLLESVSSIPDHNPVISFREGCFSKFSVKIKMYFWAPKRTRLVLSKREGTRLYLSLYYGCFQI